MEVLQVSIPNLDPVLVDCAENIAMMFNEEFRKITGSVTPLSCEETEGGSIFTYEISFEDLTVSIPVFVQTELLESVKEQRRLAKFLRLRFFHNYYELA